MPTFVVLLSKWVNQSSKAVKCLIKYWFQLNFPIKIDFMIPELPDILFAVRVVKFSALLSVPGIMELFTLCMWMGGGFCTAALWVCITVAPCPHGEKTSYKNTNCLCFSLLSSTHPDSPYLSLHLCLSVSQSSCSGRTGLMKSWLTAAISVTAMKRRKKKGRKGKLFLFVFPCRCSKEVTCFLFTPLYWLRYQTFRKLDWYWGEL